MAENNSKHLPSFGSLDELVEFFDTHDMGEYEQSLPEAHFDVNLQKSTHLIAIDEDVSSKLTEIAQLEQVTAQSLIDDWLREKISGYSKQA